MKMNRLFKDILLCRLIEEETAGPIIVKTNDKPVRATVLMRGPGKITKKGNLVAMETEVGDVVYFQSLSEHHYKGMEEGTVLISESSILGIEDADIN